MHHAHTIEIKIAKAELPESLIELNFDEMGLVRGVPEFGGDKELLAGDNGRDDFLECPADRVLILVYHS